MLPPISPRLLGLAAPSLFAVLTVSPLACGGEAGTMDADATGGEAQDDGDAETAGGGDGGDGDGDGGGGEDGDCDATADDDTTTLVFINRCDRPVEMRGSDIEGGTISAGGRLCRDVGTTREVLPAKRYWGWIGEDPGGGHHTLAEFTFNTDFQDFDWYNISHVDAHNLTMRIEPIDRADCDALVCSDSNLLEGCPAEGRYENPSGELVSCVSPDRDNPQSPVALHFEMCDDAYAWSGDDQHGDDPSPVRACAGEDWEIEFCP